MTALTDLTDVQLTSVTANDVLQYNSGTSFWVNRAIGSASGLQPYNVNTSITNVAETRGATINMADFQFLRPELRDYHETVQTVVAAGTTTINIESGNIVRLTQDTNITTLTITNPSPTNKSCSLTIVRVKDNTGTTRSITWPASFRWVSATAPTLTQTANAVDIITAFTTDAGTTWFAFAAGLNMS